MDKFLYQAVIENATDAVVVTESKRIDSPEGPQIIFVNNAYVEMTGYSKEEVIGKTPRILQGPETDRNELDKLRHALENKQPGQAELINYRKNGEKFWTSIKIFPVEDPDNEKEYWVGIKRDITERKKAYEELISTLSELHHRVKNNLAVISGMMQLHALNEKNDYIREQLEICTSRIKTIANIHELLYKQERLAKINLQEGIKELVEDMLVIFGSEKDINTTYNLGNDVYLNISQSVPLALIINEVVTNCIKHAFDDITDPEINIKLLVIEDQITLKIIDNGHGLPGDFNPHEAASIGMQLIDALSKQLEADYQFINNDQGTIFSITFTQMPGQQYRVSPIHSIMLHG